MRLSLRSDAAADIESAFLWYETQRIGLGSELLDEIQACLERIAQHPELYPAVYRDARRALVARFPYSVYYRTRPDEVRVLAVIHQHRDPRRWQRRVDRQS